MSNVTLETMRADFDRKMDAVCEKNDHERAYWCDHCSYEVEWADCIDIVTPCHSGFRRTKTPEWIASKSAEEGKHNCPVNRACWIAANVYLLAVAYDTETAMIWKLSDGAIDPRGKDGEA